MPSRSTLKTVGNLALTVGSLSLLGVVSGSYNLYRNWTPRSTRKRLLVLPITS